ncbi:MAG TPA: MEDS domain-containing protein [Alphaproteobacteria bacterium]|nr:MEDS domain-containing protein [Alphaproteobacteria bacterium]
MGGFVVSDVINMIVVTARQIRAARGYLGWSQRYLADRAGISVNALNRLESGGVDTRMSTLQAIARALNDAGIEFSSDGVHLIASTGQQHFASKPRAFEHSIQFYENDAYLVDQMTDFVRVGLHGGDNAVVFATKPHRDVLERRLRTNISRAAAQYPRGGQYVALDAADVLSKFAKDGRLDEGRASDWIMSILKRATYGGNGRAWLYGELAPILCSEGKYEAAIRLEALWNKLAKAYSMTLVCAYSMHDFPRVADGGSFLAICNEHTRVMPAETDKSPASADEHYRAIAILRQKTLALETDFARREQSGKKLRRRDKA